MQQEIYSIDCVQPVALAVRISDMAFIVVMMSMHLTESYLTWILRHSHCSFLVNLQTAACVA
jgi:hypothetical protein